MIHLHIGAAGDRVHREAAVVKKKTPARSDLTGLGGERSVKCDRERNQAGNQIEILAVISFFFSFFL